MRLQHEILFHLRSHGVLVPRCHHHHAAGKDLVTYDANGCFGGHEMINQCSMMLWLRSPAAGAVAAGCR